MKRVIPIVVFFMCLCGCNLSKHLARASSRVEKMYANTKEWSSLPEKSITWYQAISMMKSGNLELAELQDTIEQCERNSLSVYTDMIPGVSYGGYMNRTLSDLSAPMSSDELRSHVNVTFYLPELTNVPYTVYASKVETYTAMKRKEGKQRDLVSRLYQLVRMRELEERKDALVASMPDEDQKEPRDQRLAKKKQRDEKYWQEVGQILGRRDARWKILASSMPKVNWAEYNPHLDRLDELVVYEMVLRLESARMAQYGVALRYAPLFQMGMYSPELFSSSGGMYGGTFLGGDDTRLSLNISYNLDTKLSTWNRYQNSKARYEREKVLMADRLVEHKNKIRLLRESVTEYSNWRSYMLKRMEYLRSSTPQGADEYIERAKMLRNMEMELINQEIASVDSEAAVVQEYGMPDELRHSGHKKK